MNAGGALAGGLAGALLSSAAWIGIGYATGYELGILALFVGLACGIGVAIGTKGHAGTNGGLLAAVLAIGAILGSRYVIVQMSLNQWLGEASAESMPGADDDQYWTGFIADRIVSEYYEQGEELVWPGEDAMFYDDAASAYPPGIWAEAERNWDGFSPSEREEFRAAAARMEAAELDEFRGVMGFVAFLFTCLHPMSLVILAIAVGTAFKTAAHSTPVEPAENSFGSSGGAESSTASVPGIPGLPMGPATGSAGGPPTGATPARPSPPRTAAKGPASTHFDNSNRSPLDRYAPPPNR